MRLVESHKIVPLRADMSRSSPEIERALSRYNSISIPLTVIISPGSADAPIILRDTYTRATLIEKLEEAVGNQQASASGSQSSVASSR